MMRENVNRYARLAVDVAGFITFGLSSLSLASGAFEGEKCNESSAPDAFKCSVTAIGSTILAPITELAIAKPAFDKNLQHNGNPNLGFSISTIIATGLGLDASRILVKSLMARSRS